MPNYEQIQREKQTIQLLNDFIEYINDKAFLINTRPVLDADEKVLIARIEDEVKFQKKTLAEMEEEYGFQKGNKRKD